MVQTWEKLLRLEPAMWEHPRLESVFLATNTAEGVLRPAESWLKLSIGTQSEDGNAFMPRMIIIMTLGAQGRNVVEFMAAPRGAVRRSAGPCTPPLEITEPQQDELLNCRIACHEQLRFFPQP
jgi:hypothetical protein